MNTEEKREFMLLMVSEWKLSCKSKNQYCQENGLNSSKFQYWINRSKNQSVGLGHFIPLEEPSGRPQVEIIYPNGVCVKLDADLSLISQLIRL